MYSSLKCELKKNLTETENDYTKLILGGGGN
jgi:hypothetical protein